MLTLIYDATYNYSVDGKQFEAFAFFETLPREKTTIFYSEKHPGKGTPEGAMFDVGAYHLKLSIFLGLMFFGSIILTATKL